MGKWIIAICALLAIGAMVAELDGGVPANDVGVRFDLTLPKMGASTPTHEQQAYPLGRLLSESFRLGHVKGQRYAGFFMEASDYFAIPPMLMAAVVAIESGFREDAVSHSGAIGPAQVMMRYWSKRCPDAASDARANVLCGAMILAHYRDDYCSAYADPNPCALAHYNLGPGNLDRKPVESLMAAQRYTQRVQHALYRLQDHVDQWQQWEEEYSRFY